jgi:hypothetical protein
MPDLTFERSDANELAGLLAFLTEWINGADAETIASSLTSFIGSTSYHVNTLRADLHRFVFLLGATDGEDLFGQPHQ